MRTLCTLVLLGVVVIAALGFYFQWWGISTTSGPNHSQVQMKINKEKIREDINKVKETVGELKPEAGHAKTEAQPQSSHQ